VAKKQLDYRNPLTTRDRVERPLLGKRFFSESEGVPYKQRKDLWGGCLAEGVPSRSDLLWKTQQQDYLQTEGIMVGAVLGKSEKGTN